MCMCDVIHYIQRKRNNNKKTRDMSLYFGITLALHVIIIININIKREERKMKRIVLLKIFWNYKLMIIRYLRISI